MSLSSSPEALQIRARHFAGLFLLSLATLLLELALTQILSVSLWYYFSFLVISTALLGFGVSGVTLAPWAGLRERKDLDLGLGILRTRLRSLRGIQLLVHAANSIRPFFGWPWNTD